MTIKVNESNAAASKAKETADLATKAAETAAAAEREDKVKSQTSTFNCFRKLLMNFALKKKHTRKKFLSWKPLKVKRTS